MSVMFWPFVFLAIGLLLLMLEVFIPSGGLIGLCSVACLVLCLWYAFAYSPGLGLTFMLIDLVALPLTAVLAFSLWSRTPLGRRFFLRPPAPEEIEVSHSRSSPREPRRAGGPDPDPAAALRPRRDRRPPGRRPRRGGIPPGRLAGPRAPHPVGPGRRPGGA